MVAGFGLSCCCAAVVAIAVDAAMVWATSVATMADVAGSSFCFCSAETDLEMAVATAMAVDAAASLVNLKEPALNGPVLFCSAPILCALQKGQVQFSLTAPACFKNIIHINFYYQ